MNNNLFTLLKYNFLNGFKLNKTKNNVKPTGDTAIKRVLLYSFIGVLIVFYVYGYFNMFYAQFKPISMQEYILPIFMLIAALVMFIYTIRLVESVLFKSKDYDMLSILPVSSATILSAKLIYIYIVNLFYDLIIMLPAGILYMINEGLSASFLVLLFIVIVFIPIVPIILASIISLVVGFFATKLKYTSLITSVLLIVFLSLFVLVPTVFMNGNALSMPGADIDGALQYYYPAYNVKNILGYYSGSDLLIFVFTNTILFLGFVVMVSKLYSYINQKLNEKLKAQKFVGKKYYAHSQYYVMLKKEIKKVFNTSVYLINSCFGMFLLLLLSLIIFFVNDLELVQILENGELSGYKASIIIIVFCAISAFSATTGSSISLEGKNMWLYKTLPVDAKSVLVSKVMANILIDLPFIIIASALFSIRFQLGLIVWLIVIASSLSFLLLSAVFGLIVNLKYPWFDFENEAYVVKRSLASMLSIFVPMIISIVVLAITLVLPFNQLLLFLTLSTFILLLSIIGINILFTWGVKAFNKLNI